MDGLSSATAIIALIQVATKLISICWQYRGLKGAAETARCLINQLEGLKTLLVKVDELLDGETPPGIPRRETLSAWATSERLSPFHEALQRLVQQLQPVDGIKAAKDALLFPLRQKDLEQTLGEIERMKSSLNLALTVDQSVQMGIIETGVLNLDSERKVVRDERRAHVIQKWLAASNVAANQMQKQRERQDDTGIWLLRLPLFEQWLVGPNTLLWLHGIPGSGKSVLCSTVYQHTHEMAAVGIDKIAIYFYFDVSEDSKRTTDSMLRSLISQLSHHKMHNKVLNDTYDGCQNQRQAVTSSQLLAALFDLIDDYLDVVITIDAIDEAANVQDTVETILQVHRQKSKNLHVMLTSRWTRAFETSMTEAGAYVVQLSIDSVKHDISAYVNENVGRSQKWPEAIKTSVSERIIGRAAGL